MKNLVKVFKALSDPNRIRILKMLQEKPMSVNELTAVLGISQPCVSRHLHLLKEAGLVEDRREALWINYRLAGRADNVYVPVLLAHISRWANQDSLISEDHRKMKKVDRRKMRKTGHRAKR
ncbi:MAG: metalloregulator ArsR/SmtB family transcription factor [Candidatus Edwardsbacteria bacterium]|nr:metalloregulator ArsR/SmtB family transcription factor [Candidatus Edwardsbacteria bacterium]